MSESFQYQWSFLFCSFPNQLHGVIFLQLIKNFLNLIYNSIHSNKHITHVIGRMFQKAIKLSIAIGQFDPSNKITVHFTLHIHVDKDVSHRDSEMNIACMQLCALYQSFMCSF